MFSRFHWRTSRNMEIVEHTTSSPWSANSRQVRLLRLADRSRSSPEWPRSSEIASRSTSPSRNTAVRPADRKRDQSSRPTVVLPAPERPVIQKTLPALADTGRAAAGTEARPAGVGSATSRPVLSIGECMSGRAFRVCGWLERAAIEKPAAGDRLVQRHTRRLAGVAIDHILRLCDCPRVHVVPLQGTPAQTEPWMTRIKARAGICDVIAPNRASQLTVGHRIAFTGRHRHRAIETKCLLQP